MVRNLVGTLVEVGQGRRSPQDPARVLASRDRSQAAPAAPAHGLCLLAVRYPDSQVGPESAEVPGA
jgi:tRNA pseudouridine38-40 synthase